MRKAVCAIVIVLGTVVSFGCKESAQPATKTPVATNTSKPDSTSTADQITKTEYDCKALRRDALSDLDIPWPLMRDALAAWVKQQAKFQQFVVSPDQRGDIEILEWRDQLKGYGVEFNASGFRSINLVWNYQAAEGNLSVVLSCYGAPTYYEAYNTPPVEDTPGGFVLNLWYPSQGLVFHHASNPSRQSVALSVDQDFELSALYITPAGSLDQVLRDCYGSLIRQPSDFDTYRKRVRAWPDSLERIQIDSASER
jgi:hypothetical protein